MIIKYDKNSRVKLCQNKFISIMSDYFDRKVCDGFQSTKTIQMFNLRTQLDKTNLWLNMDTINIMLNLVQSVV